MTDKKLPEGKYDVIIIGGGPGGLTAGLYTARASLNPLLVESGMAMSQITLTHLVENYPGLPEIGGFELVEKFKEQAKKFGLKTMYASVAGLERIEIAGMPGWRVKTDAGDFEALSVIVASGANWRRIGIPGEAEFTGRGVSYCATCDGALYRDRQVAVIGGGDSAVEEGFFLTKFASVVSVIHRRDELRANKTAQERAFANPRMKFVWDSVPRVIRGETKVEGVEIQNVKTKALSTVPADGVFIYVGQIPNTAFLQNVVELDEWGYIKTDELMRTNQPGVYACGDAKVGPIKQIAWAVGEGALAGIQAEKYHETMACVETTGASVQACEAGLVQVDGSPAATIDGDGRATEGARPGEGAAGAADETAARGKTSPA
jgi:thioredoxin reductase (NADPH)